MCGRFFRDVSWATLRQWYNLFAETAPNLQPQFNIAPTHDLMIIGNARVQGGGTRREFRWAHWGLIPPWAKDASLAARMINARSETVAEKPAYRAAYKRRRCLIPASGFFEWHTTDQGKQPYVVRPSGGEPMTFAGLWEENEELGVRSCTILTRAANDTLKPIHHRMPVLLHPDQFEVWLNHDASKEAVQALLGPYGYDDLSVYPVNRAVGNVRHDDPENIVSINQDDEEG